MAASAKRILTLESSRSTVAN